MNTLKYFLILFLFSFIFNQEIPITNFERVSYIATNKKKFIYEYKQPNIPNLKKGYFFLDLTKKNLIFM